MKEFIEKVAAMLKTAGISHKYLGDVFEDSIRNKGALNELLGLNSENNYRKQIAIEMSDEDFQQMYPYIFEVFRRIPGWTGTFRPTTGKITVGKDQVNITKFLSKALAEGTIPPDYKEHLMIKMGIDRHNPKAEAQIVPKFGELLNKKASNVVVVSTNPFDFFTSSAGEYKYASFKSCFRPGGEYFNGCNSLARDSFSTIAYKASVDKLDYKHGRAWMFVLDKVVAQTKSYGTFTNNERKVAREYIQSKIGEKHAMEADAYRHYQVQKWKGATNKNVLYFDDYSIDLGYPAEQFPRGMDDSKVPKLQFNDAKCMKCGRETQYPQHGICGVCSGNYNACTVCNTDLYSRNDIRVDGYSHCPACAKEKFSECPCCENYYTKGTGVLIDGREICKKCVAKTYFYCEHCKTYHKKNYVKQFGMGDLGEYWCNTCFVKDAFTCQDCGANHVNAHKNEVTVKGGNMTVCNNCIPAYQVCPKCNVHFKGGFNTCDGNVCSDCFSGYDMCIGCNQFVPNETLLFDGKKHSCSGCCKDATEASNEQLKQEILDIVAAVEAAEKEKQGDLMAMLQRAKEDRDINGFLEGDILRITGDSSYHQYTKGTLLVNCKKYDTAVGVAAYCTFKNGTEWFVRAADVEFARPALVPGDTVSCSGTALVITDVERGADDSITYVTAKGKVKAETCVPTDVIDPKAFMTIIYKVGEVVEIVENTSRHPFKTGDKVKVMHVAKPLGKNGLTRYVVKKGAKYGYIWGSVLDVAKHVEEPVKKAPAKKGFAKVPSF